jgi:hypothetical protein
MMHKMKITTSWAFVISLALLVGGFVFTAYEPTAPFPLFVSGIGYMAGLYGFRRYKLKVNGKNNEKSS